MTAQQRHQDALRALRRARANMDSAVQYFASAPSEENEATVVRSLARYREAAQEARSSRLALLDGKEAK